MSEISRLEEAWGYCWDALAVDEAVALNVGYDRVEASASLWDTKYLILRRDSGSGSVLKTTELNGELADHIARHEPARVIAQVRFMRDVVLATHRPVNGECPVDGRDCPVVDGFLYLR